VTSTHMCTGRKTVASEHRASNLAITSQIRYHYTNFPTFPMPSYSVIY